MITNGFGSSVRHPISGNLFWNPNSAVFSAGGNHKSFMNSDGTPFTHTRAGTGTYLAQDGYLGTAAIDELRFEYDPMDATSMSSGGWLLEDDKTNSCLRSEELDDAAWTKDACTITANAVVAPDGATTMDTIVEDGTNAAHGVSQSISYSNTSRS